MYVGRYVWYVWYAWENIGRMGWEKVRGKMGFFFFFSFRWKSELSLIHLPRE